MSKDEIIQKYWYKYLKYWAKNVRDEGMPPNEDGFWMWIGLNIIDPDSPEEDDELFIHKLEKYKI